MIQKGVWKGQYSFSNPKINELRGFEKTNFEIEILKVENNHFYGTVKDDLTTGGTEGVGDISGKVKGDKVNFVKQMPIMSLLLPKSGKRIISNKKHRPIYYSGILSEDKTTISGKWRFKFGFVWIGKLPVPINPSKGTWTMTFNKH